MGYLLDTHVLLWWLTDHGKLSKNAVEIITNQDNEIFVSSVSFWEMAIKQEIGKLKIPGNIISLIKSEKIKTLSLSADEALSIANLPKIHSDPFDRMLITQATINGLVIITKDLKFSKYAVSIIKA